MAITHGVHALVWTGGWTAEEARHRMQTVLGSWATGT